MRGGGIHLQDIVKRYGATTALDGVDLTLSPGEMVAVTGPSGAGKTTLCRLISGLDVPDEGTVFFGDEPVNDWAAPGRDIAYMFESFALYPHLSVFENVAFPLRAPSRRGDVSADTVAGRVEDVLTLTEIAHLAQRLPQALSGGQKQRVALCRCLVQRPRAYLLDEPISHLDAKLRNRLRGEIRRRLLAGGKPALWCTPDAMEAVSIADRVMVLVDGKVQQVGTPEDVYFRPANTQVARLVGDPTMNLVAGTVRRDGGALRFESPGLALTLPDRLAAVVNGSAGTDAGVVLGMRPTTIDLAGDGAAESFAAEVYAWEPFGKYAILSARVGDDIIKMKNDTARRFEIGERMRLSVDPTGLTLFDGTTGSALAAPQP